MRALFCFDFKLERCTCTGKSAVISPNDPITAHITVAASAKEIIARPGPAINIT